MARVVLLATGGTIASRATATGGALAEDSGSALLGRLDLPSGVEVRSRDVLRLNSFALTPRDMQVVLDAVVESLAETDVDGVVVTHGTDTMEETAVLVDLFHRDPRPVVFTGAQRSADSPDSDGPANLRDAIAVAAAETTRDVGTVLVFDGDIYPAWGTRKVHTIASAGFAAPDTGPIGRVVQGVPWVYGGRRAPTIRLAGAPLRLDGVRVDIVAIYPGCDATAIRAGIAAGARGVVLEATGAGNANPAICAAVAEATAAGVVVLLSTRVPAGPVVPLYTGGGGVDLVAAGAIPSGVLRPGQARMLLLALLGTGAGPDAVRTALAPPTC